MFKRRETDDLHFYMATCSMAQAAIYGRALLLSRYAATVKSFTLSAKRITPSATTSLLTHSVMEWMALSKRCLGGKCLMMGVALCTSRNLAIRFLSTCGIATKSSPTWCR